MATGVIANPGAVVEGIVTYAPSAGGERVTLAHDSVEVNTGGADAALALTADVAACVSAAEAAGSAPCSLQLTVRLKRTGVLLDEATQVLRVATDAERIDAAPVQLYEVATIRIAPGAVTNVEAGDSVVLTATPLDRQGNTVAGRAPLWATVTGGVTVGANGVVRAQAAGPARVRASAGGRDQELAFDVAAPSVASIELAPADTGISTGGMLVMRAVARAANGQVLTGRALSYTTSNGFIAPVSAVGGVVTGGALGQATITARSTEGRNGATVTATSLVRVEAAPQVQLSDPTMSFVTELGQPIPPAATVTVRNGGGGSVGNLSVTTDSLLIASLDRPTVQAVLTVRPTLAATRLPVGVPFASLVRVRSSVSGVADGILTVTLTRRPSPQIVLERSTVAFDSVPSNSTSAAVAVAVTSPERPLSGLQASVRYVQNVSPWLTTTIGTANTPSSITVRAASGALPPGTYAADVTVSATDPSQPATLRVTMRVPPAATVLLSPKTVSFGPLDSLVAVGPSAIVNVGSSRAGLVLGGLSATTVYLGSGSGWLTTLLQSTTATPTTLQLTPRPGGLPEGTYQALVVVSTNTSNSAPDTVTAQLVVRRDSILGPEGSRVIALTAGSVGAVQSVPLTTLSGDTLSLDSPGYDITYDQPVLNGWLTNVSVASQLLPTTLRFTPSAASLTAGIYTARITLKARDGTRRGMVRVLMNVSGWGAMAMGDFHGCAFNSTNSLFCWGANDFGQLGNGGTQAAYVPTASAIGRTFADVSAGGSTTCARTSAGAVFCWGSNNSGQLGNGTTDEGEEGSTNPTPTPVTGGLTFAEVSVGGDHACARTVAGVIYCWGANYYGQGGNGQNDPRLAPTAVATNLTFVQIAAGASHTCGRTSAGAVWCWGSNSYGQLGNGTLQDAFVPVAVAGGLTFIDIAAGPGLFTCGRVAGGATYCWGANWAGQLGIGTQENLSSSPRLVAGGLSFARVSIGALHACGRTAAGAAHCWGFNESYQLGTGSLTPSNVPTPVAGGLTFASISAGAYHTCGRTTAGALYCWGQNYTGQLGNGGSSVGQTPQPVAGPGSAPPPPPTFLRVPASIPKPVKRPPSK